MTAGRSTWKSRVAIGCGLILALGVVLIVVGTYWFGGLYVRAGKAEDAAKALVERFGEADAFTPSPDGAVAPDRLDAFLAVRRKLQEQCPRLEEVVGRFDAIRRADETDQKPSVGEVFGMLRGGISLGPALSDYLQARNEGLLEAGMGVGEYSYIYVLAYLSGPRRSLGRATAFDEKGEMGGSKRGTFVGMLRRRAAALRAAPAGDAAMLAALEAEIAALDRDEARRPWPDGLPEPARGTIEARRAELDAAFCGAGMSFDLATIERRGPSVQIN